MTATYKTNFETIAKIAGVALGFSIPISNAFTNICVIILLFAWCFSGIKQKMQLIFTSKITWAILGLLLVYLLGSTYSLANAIEIKLMLKKMFRLLLIPIIMSLFADLKWRRYALYSFWWAIGISLLFIFIKVFFNPINISPLLTKWHVPTSSVWITYPRLAFKDRIFTSLLFSFAIYSLLHYSVAKINTSLLCKPCRLICSILAVLCLVYLFAYCDGRSGQVICLGLIGIFFLQKFNWKEVFFYNVLLVMIISCSLYISPSNRDRYKLTVKEAKDYISHKHIATIQNQCTGLRLEFLNNSLKLFKTAPWFGKKVLSYNITKNIASKANKPIIPNSTNVKTY